MLLLYPDEPAVFTQGKLQLWCAVSLVVVIAMFLAYVAVVQDNELEELTHNVNELTVTMNKIVEVQNGWVNIQQSLVDLNDEKNQQYEDLKIRLVFLESKIK